MRGERSHDLLGRRVVSRHVVDHDNAGERPGPERTGQVAGDLVVAVPVEPDRLRHHAVVHLPSLRLGVSQACSTRMRDAKTVGGCRLSIGDVTALEPGIRAAPLPRFTILNHEDRGLCEACPGGASGHPARFVRLDRSGPGELNDVDKNAIEEALRLKGEAGDEVVVVSMGPEQATESLRTALALGADRAVLVSDPARRRIGPRRDEQGAREGART